MNQELSPREQKGMEIARTKRMSRRGTTWFVPSQSGHGKYTVIAGGVKACSCPDFETTGKPCKHIYAVEFARTETLNADGSRTVTKAIKITYTQDWPAYNLAQTTEKAHFTRLLSDLCDTVPEPEHGKGRPPLPLRDMIFSAAYKVYSTVSGRRFMTDLGEAQAQGYIDVTPHFNSIFNVTENPSLTPVLKRLIEASALPLKAVETDFAVDSSGFSTHTYSRWYDAKYGTEEKHKDWIKAHLMCGVKTNVVTSIEITGSYDNDSPQLPALLKRTADGFTVNEVSADKGYLSASNLEAVAKVGAKAFIPFKSNSVAGNGKLWDMAFHFFSLHRERFLTHYHKRSNVETTFHMIKAKFGASLRSKSEAAQVNEALLKVLCHNICCLISAFYELGIEAEFGKAA